MSKEIVTLENLIKTLNLCYAAMNYKDESGKSHNLIQVYSYKYSPLSFNNSLTDEQYKAIKSCGLIRLADNTYRMYRNFDLAELNSLMKDSGFVFSNGVFCYLEDHLGELGGILFEPDHKPRKNPENPDYKYMFDSSNAVKALNTPRQNKYNNRKSSYSNGDFEYDNGDYEYDSGYAVPKRKEVADRPLNDRLNTGNIGYNPRRKYTGSEDETAGLWYDFD